MLDRAGGTYRDVNLNVLRNSPGARGHVSRLTWDLFEPRKDQFDFSALDYLIPKLQEMGKTMSYLQFASGSPYFGNAPVVETFYGKSPEVH